ncbi:tyrosine--tRNA ligase [Streptacidiphilus pinicola]|uniref:Tyrosine--tRNA ligase n=1 Tax=Streptacidiphilus pinicola TaxID=2219663 RepID=A0A2X0K9Q5_9ACTN|nr:tyrosine--tRNA ligase [Streptacidiphilus pinicola]RAG85995.1 tyrosine--tRNA ligase [Streptacidiphilus pinicola]
MPHTPPSTTLDASADALLTVLRTQPDLREGPALDAVLRLLAERRTMDLTDLAPARQAELVHARAVRLLPGAGRLAELLESARAANRPLTVKFGIDPTAADVHLGHAVPMILASRFQRMGHRVVFIVGDVTARIGDPSGRSADRPALTEEDVRRNLAGYRRQVAPFFDFDRADFRFNSEWLATLPLPEFLGVLQRLPVSAALQREDFRTRLAAGGGLTLAELVYSVVMALDSVEVAADVELGGLDQLLNLQMCRRVMENAGQEPEVVVATGLIEGTDGSGAKMSKSQGNYVALGAGPDDVFGRLMSAADRLLPDYLRALTELLEPEVELLLAAVADRTVHPLGVKTLLASDVTATIHGLDAAAAARAGFRARFSARRFSEAPGLPVVDAAEHATTTVGELLARVVGVVAGLKQVRRVAEAGGLRLVVEDAAGGQRVTTLTSADADRSVGALLTAHPAAPGGTGSRVFLRCGRSVVELT